jgi:hypothetical protein
MFNQLTPAEVVAAIGATLRTAARNEGEPSAFERDQLMSAYSATRHLAAELAGYEPVLRDFTEQVAARLRVHGIPERDDELARLAGRLDGVASPTDVGATICELFELLDGLASPPAASLRSDVHVHLRSLADREVDLLADTLG